MPSDLAYLAKDGNGLLSLDELQAPVVCRFKGFGGLKRKRPLRQTPEGCVRRSHCRVSNIEY